MSCSDHGSVYRACRGLAKITKHAPSKLMSLYLKNLCGQQRLLGLIYKCDDFERSVEKAAQNRILMGNFNRGAGIGSWVWSIKYNPSVVPHPTVLHLNNSLFEDVSYVAGSGSELSPVSRKGTTRHHSVPSSSASTTLKARRNWSGKRIQH